MYLTKLQATPVQLVFKRDMMLNPLSLHTLRSIRRREQQLIDKNNINENKKIKPHIYRCGEKVLECKKANK